MVWAEALNLEHWFINVFSGSQPVFTFVTIIAIASMAAFFRMSNSTTLIMVALYASIMSAYLSGIYLLVVILSGLIISYIIPKLVTRN